MLNGISMTSGHHEQACDTVQDSEAPLQAHQACADAARHCRLTHGVAQGICMARRFCTLKAWLFQC